MQQVGDRGPRGGPAAHFCRGELPCIQQFRQGAVLAAPLGLAATDEQLTGMRGAISMLRDYEHFLAGDLMTALCVLDEAAAKEQAGGHWPR